MAYKEYIKERKKEYVGKTVLFEGKEYKVIDVDYNGMLLINKPRVYCESYTSPTTAIEIFDCERR